MSGITEAFFSVKIDALPRDAGREFTVGVRSASNLKGHIQVPGGLDPVFVGFDGQCADQSKITVPVGKDPHKLVR